jgi:hypothetical protein
VFPGGGGRSNVLFSRGVRGERGLLLRREHFLNLERNSGTVHAVPEFFVAFLFNGNRNFADAAGDDHPLVEMNFEIETDIDTAKLQKAAAQ